MLSSTVSAKAPVPIKAASVLANKNFNYFHYSSHYCVIKNTATKRPSFSTAL